MNDYEGEPTLVEDVATALRLAADALEDFLYSTDANADGLAELESAKYIDTLGSLASDAYEHVKVLTKLARQVKS